MITSKQLSGNKGEDLAVQFLRKKGYKIIDRNFSIRGGEIDIIALDGQTLVFIEVKARSSKQFGSPLEAITPRKMSSLIKTAYFYKSKNPRLPESLRIDAVAITLDEKNEPNSIELIKNLTSA